LFCLVSLILLGVTVASDSCVNAFSKICLYLTIKLLLTLSKTE